MTTTEIRRDVISSRFVPYAAGKQGTRANGHYEILLSCGHVRWRCNKMGMPSRPVRCYECEQAEQGKAE